MGYTHSITVALDHGQALERVRAALSDQGFGILSESDIAATFAAKLGPEAAQELGDYVILGACNPALASRALAAEPALGALLPCNVVVRRGAGEERTTIDVIDPQTMVRLTDDPEVRVVADDADTRLRAALAQFGDGPED
ncbi:DUF302 domain-containing protein [Tersicoccus sp. MR15.9]|uniref:DUF302 domain-containing protein n=1 Tax=Tersicoccus mangrovi TaxID=3121635 RepID=UPI002FE56FB5